MRVGNDYLSAMQNKYGGNNQLALAAYNAGPGRVDYAMQKAGGDPSQALAQLPSETQNYVPSVLARANAGDAPSGRVMPAPKASTDSAVLKRAQDLADYHKIGMQITPDMQKTYMLTGKMPDAGDGGALSDGDERMAKALANYQLPAGARFISTKANRAIVQRALEINPQMSTSNYDQSHKFLQDLSSNSPTSAGGVITAAKTALSHLSDLSSLSDNLPSSYGFVNKGENLFSSTFNGKTADTLKEWNTAKSKVAAEVLKMVKGGQINESESKDMLADLDPNSPNRNAAIATLAKLMVDKSQAMEDKRDSILGDNSPHTSYLSASDQKKATRLIGLSKNLELPQFAAPGGYGQAVPGSQAPPQQPAQSAQPRAINPQTGHAIVWNGSAWVPE